MKILKARYENGIVRLSEPAPVTDAADVEVIFLDRDEQRWEEIIADPSPRPGLSAHAERILADHRAGKTSPLDVTKF